MKSVVYQPDDSSRHVVRLRIWNSYDELQGLVCWRTLRQTSYVAKDGVTASGYSAEYTREIRAVSYSPVSDEITNRANRNKGGVEMCIGIKITA